MKSDPKLAPVGGWTRASLADLLAPALGREQSAEIVAGAALRLGLTSERLDDVSARAIVDSLSETTGLIGVAARFARARLDYCRAPFVQRSFPPQPLVNRPIPSMPVNSTKASTPRTWRLSEVTALLANALGKERSEEIVRTETERMKLREPFDAEGVLMLLDRIGQSPGVVGTVAQFAKSRLMLSAR